ncbi:C-reactive protein-like [Vipera latastei]
MVSFTLCLKFYSELKQDFSLFSAASRDHSNEILVFKEATRYEVSLGNQALLFQLPEERGSGLGEDLCLTWDSATGIIQLWLNRIPLPRKVVAKGYRIRRDLVILLGQDQDSYGGSLDAGQAFEGEVGEVYLWDSVLSASQLRRLQRHGDSAPLLDWSSLSYEIKGDVMVAPSIF